jgi:hypothetical protein
MPANFKMKSFLNIAIGFVLGNLFLAGVLFLWHSNIWQPSAEPITLDQAFVLISNGGVDEVTIDADKALLIKSDGRIHPETVKRWVCNLEYENEINKIMEATSKTKVKLTVLPR